jgi:hypothetical protein
MAGVKAILFNVPEWRPWANLMSTAEHDGPRLPPPSGLPGLAATDAANGAAQPALPQAAHSDRS